MNIIKNLSFNLDNFQLEVPFLEFDSEGVTAITGHSGSGKNDFF